MVGLKGLERAEGGSERSKHLVKIRFAFAADPLIGLTVMFLPEQEAYDQPDANRPEKEGPCEG